MEIGAIVQRFHPDFFKLMIKTVATNQAALLIRKNAISRKSIMPRVMEAKCVMKLMPEMASTTG